MVFNVDRFRSSFAHLRPFVARCVCGKEATEDEDEDTAELMTPATVTAMATLVSRAICGHTL